MVLDLLRGRRVVVLLALLALVLAACGNDDDEDVAEEPEEETDEDEDEEEEPEAEHSYEDGDVIFLVLPTNPGGGYDTQASFVAPHLEAELQELTGVDLTVQLEYIPGAGHLTGHMEVRDSEPDGRTILYASADNFSSQRVIEGEDLDLREFTHISGMIEQARGFLGRDGFVDELPSEDFEGLQARSEQESILIGFTSPGPQLQIMFGMLEEEGMAIDHELIQYDGTSEVQTGLLRGEIDLATFRTAGLVDFQEDNPELDLFSHHGCEEAAFAPEIPTLHDLGVPRADELCSLMTERRVVLGPPGMSEPEAAVIAEAMQNVLNDPEISEEFEDVTGSPPDPLTRDELGDFAETLTQAWEDNEAFVEAAD